MEELGIPHSQSMFHLPIEVSVYVPSTQDVDKIISASEMKLRIEEVKKFLASTFGGYSSSPVEGGFLSSEGQVVKEKIEKVTSFAPKKVFEENKELLVNKAAQWAKKWGQEAIGLEHEGDLYYVPQHFEKGGSVKSNSSLEMLQIQAQRISHHIEELNKILNNISSSKIEPWIIDKMAIASSNLENVTHYLDSIFPRKDNQTLLEPNQEPLVTEKKATGGSIKEPESKVAKVMKEFKEGNLRTSSGDLVTDRKQAVAIALSEAGISKKEKGGSVDYTKGWNNDYESDPIVIIGRKAKKAANRIGMAIATRGASEKMNAEQQQYKELLDNSK